MTGAPRRLRMYTVTTVPWHEPLCSMTINSAWCLQMACASLLPWCGCLVTIILENILHGTPSFVILIRRRQVPGQMSYVLVSWWDTHWQNGEGGLQWRNRHLTHEVRLSLRMPSPQHRQQPATHACTSNFRRVVAATLAVKFYCSAALPWFWPAFCSCRFQQNSLLSVRCE